MLSIINVSTAVLTICTVLIQVRLHSIRFDQGNIMITLGGNYDRIFECCYPNSSTVCNFYNRQQNPKR